MNLSGDNQEYIAHVLRQRASQLAARRAAVAEVASWRGLAFVAAGERFCLPLENLVEVLPFQHCTPIPAAPPELLGVMNVRGEIRSILDLARMLSLPVPKERPPGYVVLVRYNGAELGLRVDEVDRIETVARTVASHEQRQEGPGQKQRTPSRAVVLKLEELLANNHDLQRGRKLQ